MRWYSTINRDSGVRIREIPLLSYADFFDDMSAMLSDADYHCVSYFAVPTKEFFILFALVARDSTGEVLIASYIREHGDPSPFPSLTAVHPSMRPFEGEITESHGIRFEGNPWDKPVRFPHSRADRGSDINNYPFYSIQSKSLHEVNVGPIHAGIIEPGVFRFICDGETVVSLEIVLGFQHRGVEQSITATSNRLRQSLLCEGIAGDSSVAHTTAFSSIIEKLSTADARRRLDSSRLDAERAIGLELERIAMHIADTGALCTDIGYQLGQVACEALRTIVINTTQLWCGNRFGKGLVRPGGSNYPLDDAMRDTIIHNVQEVARRYAEVANNLRVTPSVLARFEDCGIVTATQATKIGAVGMAARASGLKRDIRASHPWGIYGKAMNHTSITGRNGDVMDRLNLRIDEVGQSSHYILYLLGEIESFGPAAPQPSYHTSLEADTLAFSLVEGWRGEICHVALTSPAGKIAVYKVCDPSIHNWTALSLSVRGRGISDFPICNKSFNLSYCGHDL